MTVKELIAALQAMPQDLPVRYWDDENNYELTDVRIVTDAIVHPPCVEIDHR